MICACGCGTIVGPDKRGRSRRYVHGHNARRTPNAYEVQDRGYDSPCWIWLRTRLGEYGGVWTDGRMRPAHRVYYERVNGPVPDGYELDHLCRNQLCVNPDHLEVVTHSENVRRGYVARTVDANPFRLKRHRLGLTQYETARRFGVVQTAVSAWERGVNPLPRDWSQRLEDG